MPKKVAVLAETDVNDLEFWYPYLRLIEEDFEPIVAAPKAPMEYVGKYGTHIEALYTPASIKAEDFSGIVSLEDGLRIN